VRSLIIFFTLLLFANIAFSQSILYKNKQSGIGFFGSYSGDVNTSTFGLGGMYSYSGKFGFGYSYGYTLPNPNSEALYAIGNRLSFNYLWRKQGDLGDYAIEPGIGFSWGEDQETRYRVITGGISIYKPIILNEVSGLIPEFSVGGRLITDIEYRYVFTFGGSLLFYLRSNKRSRNLPYIKGGLLLTNYGSLFFIKIGIALATHE